MFQWTELLQSRLGLDYREMQYPSQTRRERLLRFCQAEQGTIEMGSSIGTARCGDVRPGRPARISRVHPTIHSKPSQFMPIVSLQLFTSSRGPQPVHSAL